jgi:hypothetical protein
MGAASATRRNSSTTGGRRQPRTASTPPLLSLPGGHGEDRRRIQGRSAHVIRPCAHGCRAPPCSHPWRWRLLWWPWRSSPLFGGGRRGEAASRINKRSFSSGGGLKGAVVREEQWRDGLSVSGSIGARAGATAMASSGAPSAPLAAYGGPCRRGSQGDGELEMRGDSELEVDLTAPTDLAARAMAAAPPAGTYPSPRRLLLPRRAWSSLSSPLLGRRWQLIFSSSPSCCWRGATTTSRGSHESSFPCVRVSWGYCDNPTRDNSVLSPKPLHLVIKR